MESALEIMVRLDWVYWIPPHLLQAPFRPQTLLPGHILQRASALPLFRWRLIQLELTRPVYAEMFDGLRSYYSRYESRRAAAGFHAAATLSFICCVAITAGVTVINYFVAGNIDWSVQLFEYKAGLILCGVAVGYAHIQFGKHTGRYHSTDLSAPPGWKAYLTLYVSVSGSLLVGAIIVALMSRPGLS
jgi:hypothetical protein